ncbi:hypothetical protein KDN24_17745 [Bacillus sp. Bva_UNVM-123]|uniref:ABC transporter permease subunit n=1 Tax=Bacillus sp. Bva_UNVM-123 TaxID=2829798 RepID=UPI00391EF765
MRKSFPNILSPVIVLSTLQIGNSILITAELSFLGLGAQPSSPEWGSMIFVGRSFLAMVDVFVSRIGHHHNGLGF